MLGSASLLVTALANLTPSTNSVPSPSPSTPDIGSATPRWPEKIQPPTRTSALMIKGRATKKQTPLRTPIKIKIITAEKVTLATPVTPVMLTLAVAILTRRSPTLTFPQSLEKTASSHKQSNSTISSRTSACSAAKLDTSPKNVPRRLPLPPKPAPPPPWIRAPTPSLAWSQKIREQSSTLHTD